MHFRLMYTVIVYALSSFAAIDDSCGLALPPASALVGVLSARPALFAGPSVALSVGAETMDRGFTNYSSWGPYLGPLGVRTARLQGGWAKCEPAGDGVYSFEWLDGIVSDMLAQGVTPWLQLSFGNPAYAGGGTAAVSSPLPSSDAALAGWDAWVRAAVSRVAAAGVDTFEVWNEPNIQHIDAESYAVFVARTARVIAGAAPAARVRFGALAGSGDAAYAGALARALARGNASALLDALTYHPYDYNPDASYAGVAALRAALDGAGLPRARLAQGENGAPSEGGGYGALTAYNWTECSQAKYFARRLLRDAARGTPSSAFSIVDLCYAAPGGGVAVNHKGLLAAACAPPGGADAVTRVKAAYAAVARVAAALGGGADAAPGAAGAAPMQAVAASLCCAGAPPPFGAFASGWWAAGANGSLLPVFALWNASGTPLSADAASTVLCDVNLTVAAPAAAAAAAAARAGAGFVGADMMTGAVFSVAGGAAAGAAAAGPLSFAFTGVPVSDSPLLLAPARALAFVPTPPAGGALPAAADVSSTVEPLLEAFTQAHYASLGDCHWERAAYFFGNSAARDAGMAAPRAAAAHDAFARAWAARNGFGCNGSAWPGDVGIAWTVDALVRRGLAPPAARDPIAAVMAAAAAARARYAWSWVDTLAFNLPEWLRYADALGRPDWTAHAAAQWADTKLGVAGNASAPGLWSSAHGLWFRDAAHANASAPGGGPVFWGRGNAWAAVAIVYALDARVLPPGDALRADLEATLVAMAAAYARAQDARDALWRASLLDAAAFPNPETTASAGALALLAFGVRAGLLDAAVYAPAVARGWAALATTGLARGGAQVQFCQPVGAAPAAAQQSDASDFCAGLFLLAAEQVYRLAAQTDR
jgi:hypothetical protein